MTVLDSLLVAVDLERDHIIVREGLVFLSVLKVPLSVNWALEILKLLRRV